MRRRPGAIAAAACLGALVGSLALAGAAVAAQEKPSPEQVREIRVLEDAGAYGRAAFALRALRGAVAPDADLELALALDEARAGLIDSAAARLWGPLLEAALVDSLPATRRTEYPIDRGPMWLNGRFDGWHWYVARARAEVGAALGRWEDALEAARACARARPLSGKEWLVLAICADHAGHRDEADTAAGRAVFLDPSLPEAHYVRGLFDWRAGRRSEARARFARAVALDSSYRAAALAGARARLPIGTPPAVPTEFLTGDRAAGLLTSPVGPKLEDFVQMDEPGAVLQATVVTIPDSIAWTPPGMLSLPVLIGADGHIVLHALPWFPPPLMPETMVHLVAEAVPTWAFRPAIRLGEPHAVWTSIEVGFTTHDPDRAAAPPGDSR